MLNRLILACLLLCPLFTLAENPQDEFTQQMQAAADAFTPLELPGKGPIDFDLKLGETTATLKDGNVFDGFRFTAPEGSDQLDMIWYFNAPGQWGNWYILPVKGGFKPAFKDWTDADRLYEKFDVIDEDNQLRVLQNLEAGYFEPGQEYIMWFRRVHEGGDDHLRGRLMFAKAPEDGWDESTYEEALALEPQPVEVQVEWLDSRGGRIMLDEQFFTRRDAKSRIDDIFSSMRRFTQLQGGFFIAMEITMPPCDTTPKMADIIEKYGPPDFTRTSAEEARVQSHSTREDAEPEEQADEDREVVYYYDYLAFATRADDPMGEVTGVTAHAMDYRALAPDDTFKRSFGTLGTRNLTVFYEGDKEVGRMYYFDEGPKIPLVIQEPPPGVYRQYNLYYEYLGDGKWVREQKDYKDTVLNRASFEDHRRHGKSEWFSDDGLLKMDGEYQDGLPHGVFNAYQPDGEVAETRHYENGKRVE